VGASETRLTPVFFLAYTDRVLYGTVLGKEREGTHVAFVSPSFLVSLKNVREAGQNGAARREQKHASKNA
jgi:hypothetical protein